MLDLQLPRAFAGGRYVLRDLLGEGAMARVYEAMDTAENRRVAVKIVHPHIRAASVNVVRFQREVEILRRLAHPGVVTIYDAGDDPEHQALFMVMEMLEGLTLEDALSEQQTPRTTLLATLREALPPLFAAHHEGVVHRDLKPANVFLSTHTPGPAVKLLDFGIASLDGGPQATLTEVTVGTPSYMAPEQATRAKEAGPPADLWSIGVMMYRIVAGRLPFDGEGAYDTVMRACVEPHAPLPDGAPHALVELVERCLTKTPGDRPESARTLARAIDALLVDSAVVAYLDGLDVALGYGSIGTVRPTPAPVAPRAEARFASVTAPPDVIEETLQVRARRGSQPRLRWTLAAVLLLSFGVGAWVLDPGGTEPPPEATAPTAVADPDPIPVAPMPENPEPDLPDPQVAKSPEAPPAAAPPRRRARTVRRVEPRARPKPNPRRVAPPVPAPKTAAIEPPPAIEQAIEPPPSPAASTAEEPPARADTAATKDETPAIDAAPEPPPVEAPPKAETPAKAEAPPETKPAKAPSPPARPAEDEAPAPSEFVTF